MADSLKLSVLDLLPARTGQTSAASIDAARALVKAADSAGFHRYWVAEHHNTPAVVSTSPPVLIGILAAASNRIRLGSGGVMLPNHAPLAIAEQFAALTAAYPGRIDLGIGRAPGTDPLTAWALRSTGPDDDPVRRFPEYVQQVIAMLAPDGVGVQIGGRDFDLHATPKAVEAPPVWLLGSSDYSARLAAQLGLPYVFAHHFGTPGIDEALALYRSGWTGPGKPETFLTVNVVVNEDLNEAWRLARPQLHMIAGIRLGSLRKAMMTVEEAIDTPPPVPESQFLDFGKSWLVGPAAQVADQIRELATTYEVDEVMVQPVAGAYAREPRDRSVAREDTLRSLAKQFDLA